MADDISASAKRAIDQVKRMGQLFPQEVARALRIETETESTECKQRTPVKWGHLQSSIHVESEPVSPGQPIRTHIVAGGPSAPYALYVHEDLEAFHSNGQAKYIESTLRESAPYMAQRVAKRMKISEIVK